MKIKNNYILRLNELAKLLWIIILLGACQSDDSYSVQQDGPVLVKLSVSAADAGTASGGTYTANLLQSVGTNDNYKLVILANLPDYGFLYGLYGKSYEDVQQACLSTAITAPLVFDDSHPFPMFGVVNGGASVQVQEGTAYTGNTELIRAVARVDIGIGTKKAAFRYD